MAPELRIAIPPRKDILGRRLNKIMDGQHGGKENLGEVVDAAFVPPEGASIAGGWKMLMLMPDGTFDIWTIPEKDSENARGVGYIVRAVKSDADASDLQVIGGIGSGSHDLADEIGFVR